MSTRRRPVPYAEAARRLLRDSVLDSAAALLVEQGWSVTTVSAVAADIGVSRQRVYREFPTKGAIAEALTLREADRLLTRIDEALSSNRRSARGSVEAAVTTTLRLAQEDELLRAVLGGPGRLELLPLLTTRGQPLLTAARDRLVAFIRAEWPGAAAKDAAAVADVAVRHTLSHLLTDRGEPPERTAGELGHVLGPFLDAFGERAQHPPRGTTA